MENEFGTSTFSDIAADPTAFSEYQQQIESEDLEEEKRDTFDEDAVDVPDSFVGSDVLEQILKAKKGDPSKFQSYWEKDEQDIDFATDEEIQNNPVQRMLWAAENGKVDVVSEILEANPPMIKAMDNDGYTPLHRAAYNGHMDVLKMLIMKGADVSSQTKDGWQPIHSAANWNQFEAVALLVQNGSDVNAQTNGGQTPLMLSASSSDGKKTTEYLLMNRYIDPELKNSTGEMAYSLCQRHTGFYYLFDIVHPSINSL